MSTVSKISRNGIYSIFGVWKCRSVSTADMSKEGVRMRDSERDPALYRYGKDDVCVCEP